MKFAELKSEEKKSRCSLFVNDSPSEEHVNIREAQHDSSIKEGIIDEGGRLILPRSNIVMMAAQYLFYIGR